MTIKNIIEACEEVHENTEVMIYHSVEDYDNATANWNSCIAESIAHSECEVAKFSVRKNFLIIALK